MSVFSLFSSAFWLSETAFANVRVPPATVDSFVTLLIVVLSSSDNPAAGAALTAILPEPASIIVAAKQHVRILNLLRFMCASNLLISLYLLLQIYYIYRTTLYQSVSTLSTLFLYKTRQRITAHSDIFR